MLAFYRKKFVTDDIGFILRSLLYFDDAENQTNPIALNNTTWGQVKEKIESAVKNFTHNEIQNWYAMRLTTLHTNSVIVYKVFSNEYFIKLLSLKKLINSSDTHIFTF